MEHSEFLKKLRDLLNCACRENISNTPDFLIAEYLIGCLVAFEAIVLARDRWYGVHLEPCNKYFEDAPAEKGESSQTSTNKQIMPCVNCTKCHRFNHCVCEFGGKVCSLKYEPRTA